jgi:hypothetical protein
MNSLEVRRTRLEIVTATKILQGHIDSPEYVERLSRLYVPDNYLRIRTGRRHQLFSRPARSLRSVACMTHSTHSWQIIPILMSL